jgi:O-antigen ligase
MLSVERNFLNSFIFSCVIYLFSGNLIVVGYILSSLFLILPCFKQLNLISALPKNPVFLPLLTFIFYSSIVSAVISLAPAVSSKTIVKFLSLSLLGFIALVSIHRLNSIIIKESILRNRKVIITALFIINIVMLFEHLTNYSLTLFFRDLLSIKTKSLGRPIDKITGLFTMVMPAVYLAVAGKNKSFILLSVLTIINYLFHPMLAAKLSLLFAITAGFLTYKFGKNFIKFYFSFLIAKILFLPIVLSYAFKTATVTKLLPSFPQNWYDRAEMWQKAVMLIREKPLLGYGINAASTIDGNIDIAKNIVIQVHPHNIILQLWLETGLVGMLLLALAVYKFYQSVSSIQDMCVLATTIASLSSFLVFANISFGIWRDWWLCSIWLAVLMVAFLNRAKA